MSLPTISTKLESAKSIDSNVSFQNKQISVSDIKFLKEVSFLETWPIDKFTEESNTVKSCVFNRYQVITLDSNSSKFIYVVKSGTIDVLISINQTNNISTEDDDESIEIDSKKNMNEGGYFPLNPLLDDHHREILLLDGMLKMRTDEEVKKVIESKMRLNEVMNYLASMKKLDVEVKKEPDKTNYKERLEIISNDNHNLHHSITHHVDEKLENIKHFLHIDDNDTISGNEDLIAIGPNRSKSQSISESNNQETNAIKKKLENIKNEQSKNNDTFLFVHKLTPGDYFGLADLLFDKQPSLILVSNSCECILISKEFYVQNSSIEYLKRLKKNQAPYPKIDEIVSNYKNYLKWKGYSKKVLEKHLK